MLMTYHTIEENLKMRFFDAKVAPIRPLNEARAVELGANFMSESLLFGVAGLTIFLEAWRSSHKASTRVTTVDDTFERLSAERQQDAESLEALQAVVRDVRGELGEVQDAVKALTLAVSALAGGKGNDSAKGGTWLWGGGRSDDNEVARRMAELTLPDEPVHLTQSSTVLLTTCRPLPDDIDTDASCSYCGVSYLLHSKYNTLVRHVSSLETELFAWKKYAVEHPILVERASKLEKEVESAKQSLEEADKAALESKAECGRMVRELHELQLRHTRLTHEMETELRNAGWLEESRRSQIRSLVRALVDLKDDLKGAKDASRAGVKKMTEKMSETMIPQMLQEISATIYGKLPGLIKGRVEQELRIKELQHGGIVASLRAEIESLKEDLEDNRGLYHKLADELRSTKSEYETHLESRTDELRALRAKTIDLEDVNSTRYSEISKLRGDQARIEAALADARDRLTTEIQMREQAIVNARAKEMDLREEVKRKEGEIAMLKEKLEATTKQATAGEMNANASAQKALAQKDIQINDLRSSIRNLNSNIDAMKAERVKTIEAHQSRIAQLQDNFHEKLKNSAKAQSDAALADLKAQHDTAMAELKAQIDVDKRTSLEQQKSILQQQLQTLKATLQSQLDAARLSRDAADRRARECETTWSTKLNDKVAELSALRTRLESVQEELRNARRVAEPRPPKTPPPAPVVNTAEMEAMRERVARGDAEIAFLKETVRVECEERMELLKELDTMRRGLGGGKGVKSKGGNDAVGSVAELEGKVVEEDNRLYQSMAAKANFRKNQKLRKLY
ncbi:hypothetical protein HK101_010613 [Irineochytrium annulatum]|nr:hypothetical protein HK101_010613 [Irineochytrium annulatum]